MIFTFFQHFLNIFVESAPWLLFGYFIAGLIKAIIPPTFLQRHLGKDDVKSVIRGAVLGAPLPLCSCGVIPAALGLRRSGASKASTTSFLIATPETGVDSVSVTYALLGPMMAIVRPIAAVTTAIIAGLAVMKWGEAREGEEYDNKVPSTDKIVSCCASKTSPEATGSEQNNTPEPETQPEPQPGQSGQSSHCCSRKKGKTKKSSETQHAKFHHKASLFSRLTSGLRFTFVDLVKDTSLWLFIGLVMAAVIMTVIPASFLQQWGATPYAYLVMALIGVPMYICATASTPIAAGLLFAGVSPGAILVFMLVGPATNIATIAMVKKELGSRVLSIYLSSVVVIGFAFAWLVDVLATYFSVSSLSQRHDTHDISTLAMVSAVVLAVMLANGLWQKLSQFSQLIK